MVGGLVQLTPVNVQHCHILQCYIFNEDGSVAGFPDDTSDL